MTTGELTILYNPSVWTRSKCPAARATKMNFAIRCLLMWFLLLCCAVAAAQRAAPLTLQFTPARSTLEFTLGATMHTVHGQFNVKQGEIHFDAAGNTITGEIIVDATSGVTGVGGRDRRMHSEILETTRYPEITFQPDQVQGTVAPHGTSAVQVHGLIGLHGAEHEVTLPVQIEMAPDHWTVTSHFVIPYIRWGLKNPNTFLLHVSPSVEVDLSASGGKP